MKLDTLLKPSWGVEKWLLRGWEVLTHEEQTALKLRVDELFKDGLPFVLKELPLLYINLFALLSQIKAFTLKLPLELKNKLNKVELAQRMHQQLLDELFHAIVCSKTLFLLTSSYGNLPSYNTELEKIIFANTPQDELQLGLVINLLSKTVLTQLFTSLDEEQIAPALFSLLLEDEKRHLEEADLYLELGLPEEQYLKKTLQNFEELFVSALGLEPRYGIALAQLLGPEAAKDLGTSAYERYVEQLKKIKQHPSHQLELAIEMGPSLVKESKQEIKQLELSTQKRVVMTQLNNPGDPGLLLQFNLDLSELLALEPGYSEELITALMMQTLSLVLAENPAFRNFLNFNKLYQTTGAYVALVEQLADCEQHLGALCFKDCHQLSIDELLTKIKKIELVMHYCYQKRAEIEQAHPEFAQRLNSQLQSYAEDGFPNPIPGSYGIYLSNLGRYGYTQIATPLLKHTGLHLCLLTIEKKPVWNPKSQSFEAKELLPISLSADSRLFDSLPPLPDLLAQAFKTILKQRQEQQKNPPNTRKQQSSSTELLAKKGLKTVLDSQVVAKTLGEDLALYRQRITSSPNLRNLADELLMDYMGINDSEEANPFKKHLDKLLAENLEQGYRLLVNLQSLWCDYVDIEKNFSTAYKNIANNRLRMLAKLLPGLVKQFKQL